MLPVNTVMLYLSMSLSSQTKCWCVSVTPSRPRLLQDASRLIIYTTNLAFLTPSLLSCKRTFEHFVLNLLETWFVPFEKLFAASGAYQEADGRGFWAPWTASWFKSSLHISKLEPTIVPMAVTTANSTPPMEYSLLTNGTGDVQHPFPLAKPNLMNTAMLLVPPITPANQSNQAAKPSQPLPAFQEALNDETTTRQNG